MPFTFSHPALILPLTYLPRKFYSLTGLIIGSMSPDFEYFIRMKIKSEYSHTMSGLFWFDLPIGLLFAYLFHKVIKDSLFYNSPIFLKSRFVKFCDFDWDKYFKTNWFVVIVSILIGAASHLFWDSFTHKNGYFIETIPFLSNQISILKVHIPFFKILQHSSTFLGGLVIAIALFCQPIDKKVTGQINFKYWIFVAGLTLILVMARLSYGLNYKVNGNLLVTFISCSLISLTIIPLLIKMKNSLWSSCHLKIE